MNGFHLQVFSLFWKPFDRPNQPGVNFSKVVQQQYAGEVDKLQISLVYCVPNIIEIGLNFCRKYNNIKMWTFFVHGVYALQ